MDTKQEDTIIKGVINEEPVVAVEDARTDVVQSPALQRPASDTYAIGIHVMKMAPAWLLTVSVFFVMLILLLSWLRPDAGATGSAAYNPNDSKSPATDAAILSVPVEAPAPAKPASPPSTSPKESQPSVAVNAEQPAPVGAREAQADAQAVKADASVDSEQKFTVQVGSHSDQSSANEQVSRLRTAGFDARTVAVELPGRGTWYRVQAGSFDDRKEASKAAAALRAKGVAPGGIVVPQ